MGGKAKWRKLKRVVGPMPQGTQAPAKQHFKKERTKTRDAKRRRMGDGGDEDEDEADAAADGSKKDLKQSKDAFSRSPSKKGQESLKSPRGQTSNKPPVQTNDETVPIEDSNYPVTIQLSQAEGAEVTQDANGVEETVITQTPQLMVTDLDSPIMEGLQNPNGEESLKEELRKATEEDYLQAEDTATEDRHNNSTKDLEIETGITELTPQEIQEELLLAQKSTQTEAVNINNGDKPVKFFISDDSDSDTAIFVDAHPSAPNGDTDQMQGVDTEPVKDGEGIEFSAVIDVKGESAVEVTFEGQDIEFGIEDASEQQNEAIETIGPSIEFPSSENQMNTQLVDVEPSDSPRSYTFQRAKYLPSLAQPAKTETQKLFGSLRKPHGPTKFPFDHLLEGDNVSKSSTSDSVENVSIERSSISDLADPELTKTSTSDSAELEAQSKVSTGDSADLDTPSVTSVNESVEQEAESKASLQESAEQETMTMTTTEVEQETMTLSTAESIEVDIARKMSTIESAEPGTISKSSTRGSIDQDIISKSSASESGEPEFFSKTSASESGEPEFQSKTSYSEYEEAEGRTRTSVSEYGEADSISRTSVSESAEHDGTSRTSASDSATGTSQASMTATGTSANATGEFRSSKSSVSCSSEFDAESLTSTADLLTPKEEIKFVSYAKAVPGLGEQAKLERDSPTEETVDRPGSPGWEELNLEDHMQIIGEGGSTEDALQIKKEGSEADTESLFFSLYPEYQPGEVDESQAEITNSTGGNPKILCFRGQTTEQEGQEEIYMACEKGDSQGSKGDSQGSKDSRSKGAVSGKFHQFQRKLSQQKKSEREDKEVTEPEGSPTQQGGNGGSDEQQDTTEQISQGSPTDGGPQSAFDPTGGKQLSDVSDGSTPPSITQATDEKEAEHSICQAKDNLVCFSGQFGEQVESIVETIEVVTEVTKSIVQAEKKPADLEDSNGKSELGHEALEAESKLEANSKDRKTLVGKAKDWIKGVTRMGSKKEELSDKPTDKAETKKAETEGKPALQRKTSADVIAASVATTSMKHEEKDTLFDGKEKETSFIMYKEQLTEEEQEIKQQIIYGESNSDKVAAETDEIRNRKNASILESADIMDIKRTEENLTAVDLEEDQSAHATDNGSQENGESLRDKQETAKEKEESDLNQEVRAQVSTELDAEIIDQSVPEDELFDIVSPEEELSDSVFKDEKVDDNGKAKESDDTEVQQPSPDEVLDAEMEKISSAEIKTDEEPGYLMIPKQEEQVNVTAGDSESTALIINGNSHVICDKSSRESEADNQEDLVTISTENEASYVSVPESIEQDSSATAWKLDTESTPKDSTEKRRKTTKDETKPHRKRHEKSKSPSVYKENGKEESPKASQKDKEGKRGSKKKRHRRRTKSQEDGTEIQRAISEAEGVRGSTEPRPEDVAYDFETEKKIPPSSGKADDTTAREKGPESLEEKKDAETTESQISNTELPAQEDSHSEKAAQKPDMQTSQIAPDQECLVEKRKSSSRSSKERKHSKKSEGDHSTSERKHHSKSRRERSLDSKQEKQDTEKLEKETKKTMLKPESSPRENLSKEEGSSFPATAATWSPRLDRKEGKSSKKSSDRKREEHSRDRPKIPKETGEVKEQSLTSSKTLSETRDDEPHKKTHKTSRVSKGKIPEPIILPAEPRDDTPIPSPKSEPQLKRFDIDLSQTFFASSKDTASTGSQPLLQVFTFPEGVSKPISPAPVIKELKFPPGVSKPVSPLPKKAKAPTFPSKPIPAPLTLHPDPDLTKQTGKPVSPLRTLTFPEGVSKPISPMPQIALQLIPKPEVTSISSLNDDKPLPYPAIPVSPLRMLNFPEGIPKPKSPLPPKLQEKSEFSVKSISSIPEVQPMPSNNQYDKEEPSAPPTADEVPKPLSPPLKKPRPRLILPKVADSLQTTEASKEPAKPVSPLKTLQFPEGISKPMSPVIKKAQQAQFILDSQPEKPEKLTPEPETITADSSKFQVPMKEPARPVSPLKPISFPAGISKPVSPLPLKATQPLFKPIPRPIPPPLDSLIANEEVSQNGVSELEKKESTTLSQSASLTTTVTRTEVLTTLSFPKGVSKPISPLPQKTKFSGELFKPVPETTKPASPLSELLKTVHSIDKPSPVAREIIRPAIPSDFFKTVHEGEKPTSAAELIKSLQAAAKPSSPSTDLLESAEKTSVMSLMSDQPSQLTTFKFPEGVSKPISPLPVKGKPHFSTVGPSSPAQKMEMVRSPTSTHTSITTKTESPSIFSFTITHKKDEKAEQPKSSSPVVPLTQRWTSDTDNKEVTTTKPSTVISQILKHSTPDSTTPITPAPLKIKHFVDYPSDTFPCTKPKSPASQTVPPPLIKPASPGFKIGPPVISSPTTTKPALPLLMTASPITKVAPCITKPQSPAPDTKLIQEAHELLKQSEKSDNVKEYSPDRLDKIQPESCKRSPLSRSPEHSFRIQLDSDTSITKSISPDLSPRTKAESTRSAVSQTHLTYSEASKRFTPSPRPLDELSKEITPTPPMTPPPEPEKEQTQQQQQQQLPSSPCMPSRAKHDKYSPAAIKTMEARTGAKYSRGEEPNPSSKPKSQRDDSKPREGPLILAKDEGKGRDPPVTSTTHSLAGIRCCSDRQQTPRETLRPSPDITRSRHEGSHSPKEGSRSPHAGSDSASKKLRRRKRR